MRGTTRWLLLAAFGLGVGGCTDQIFDPVNADIPLAADLDTDALPGGTIIVRPSNAVANAWFYFTTNTAVGSYVPGPGGQVGLLPGSLKFETKTGANVGGKPQFVTGWADGITLADLTSLEYRSRIATYATGTHLTITLNLWIDRDGDLVGTTGDRHNLVFEPCYTTSCAGPIQLLDTWTTWDARAAGAIWWSTSIIPGTDFTSAFNSFKPLTTILSTYPNAKAFALYVQAGQSSGGAPWDGFIGYADGVALTVSGTTTTYDFEPDPTPPIVTNVVGTPNPTPVGGATVVTANVSDATTGGSNIQSAEYSLDGVTWSPTAAADGAYDEVSEDVTAGFSAPAAPGIYDLCVRGTDAEGFTSEPECVDLVVYDPSGGFVTGGGWIDSPSGAASKIVLSTVWDQGFESDAAGWFDSDDAWYGQLTMVLSGTDGIPAFAGAHYAQVSGDDDSGPFSRFDGYRDTWAGTWVAQVAVYLDPAWPAGAGFDYSVAANGSDGLHQRDYIFHVTKDQSTGKLLVAGSNNTNFAPREDLETINHHEVTSAGWYILQHTFRDQAGALAVDLQLLDGGGTVLFTETRFNAADLIPAEVGGNRYAWFTVISGVTLAVDDHQLKFPILVYPTGKATFGFVSKYVKGKNLPTGQTEFVFKAAGINFHSEDYEWLVVNQAGTNAQFKGRGTINGAGDYMFMLWAGDGDQDDDPLTLDTFRIKIWDTATSVVVYDNSTDQPIAGGNIMVHAGKKSK